MARLVAPGAEIERAPAGAKIGRHHHLSSYAALVLRGGYVEAGDRGRIAARPGDVLFHHAFEGHADQFDRSGAEILNLPVPTAPPVERARVADPDSIVRFAERDGAAAAELLLEQAQPLTPTIGDWPDLLALALRRAPVRLDSWAAAHGLTPSSVSRGFRLAYGTSPKRYRIEQCAAAAARAIAAGSRLVDACLAAGFADQPHMTRTLRLLYGVTPRRLRDLGKSVQDGGCVQD